MHMSQSLRLSENCSTCFGFHYHPFSEAQNNCNYSYYDARTHEIKKKGSSCWSLPRKWLLFWNMLYKPKWERKEFCRRGEHKYTPCSYQNETTLGVCQKPCKPDIV